MARNHLEHRVLVSGQDHHHRFGRQASRNPGETTDVDHDSDIPQAPLPGGQFLLGGSDRTGNIRRKEPLQVLGCRMIATASRSIPQPRDNQIPERQDHPLGQGDAQDREEEIGTKNPWHEIEPAAPSAFGASE